MTWMRLKLCRPGTSGENYDEPVSPDTLSRLRKTKRTVGTTMRKVKIACDEPHFSNLKLVHSYAMCLYFISICFNECCIPTPCLGKRMQMSIPLNLVLMTRWPKPLI